jgi:MoaA/NifB/PqqE/SkfB family radical SAM enzyme
MKILREYDQYILTNTVITTSNYRELPALATLLAQLGVDQFQFAFIHILGTADNNKQWIVPRKTDIMPYVKKGLRIGKEHGMVAMTEAIPYCFMVGYEEFIGESYMPETTVYDAKYVTESYKEYRWNEGKVRCSDCTLCLYKGPL